jgi:predicted SprT family Zn-dependent metalloprotease
LDYNKKIIRMSLPLAVSNLKEANDTLFHELAHALTPSCGHNEWKEACVKLGATPERLAPANITARSTFAKTKTYKLTCPCCNFYATKSRKSSSSSSCPKCDKNITLN